MLVDSHCHLDRLDLSVDGRGLAAVLADAEQAGVGHILCVATDAGRWAEMMALIEPFPQVLASAGVHPLSDEIQYLEEQVLLEQVRHPRVVAVGETGLDYHYSADTAKAQQRAFALQLQIAATERKPIIIHSREAQADTLALLREAPRLDTGAILHCFTEDWAMAKASLDLGLYISFSGIITFRNAAPLRDVVRQVPLDRLLVETDAPYLTPAPYRGRSNEPQYVRRVAECVAEVKGITYDEVVEQTTRNFQRLFGR